MMLLRTLVLERGGDNAPVNGALLCGFAVAQAASNFLVYSLDEETEPGSSRIYIATLRKKLERYFLGGIESKDDLHVAMQVFKQILMVASASGTRTLSPGEPEVPFHFIDLKGCKLPPARPEDHHSVIIKKALVMKVITLGMSAPALPAIESASLIVPSIRFSSQMVSPPRIVSSSEPTLPLEPQHAVEREHRSTVALPLAAEAGSVVASPEPAINAPPESTPLFEVDNTLASLARVAHDLTQQQLAVTTQETRLEQWQARLQQEQRQMDEKAQALELRQAQLQEQVRDVSRKEEQLASAMTHLSGLRQSLRGVLPELDQALDG
ncbi:hypothetical protein [Pseudomonas sp. SDO5271_S396]